MIKIIDKIKQQSGFTLAEILITLAVIGVVASIVVPNIVGSYEKQMWWSAFKKEFASLSQAVIRMRDDGGGSIKGLFTSNDIVASYLTKYLNVSKSCTVDSQIFGNCWHNNNEVYRYDGIVYSPTPDSGLVFTDGTLLIINQTFQTCPTYCANITIDVNGFKKPNIIGKDIYFVFITENLLVPRGTPGLPYFDECGAGTDGSACAALVLTGKDY